MHFGFLSLGLLIGALIGLTSDSVVSSAIPLLFAFGGGSAVAFLTKLEKEQRDAAGMAIAALSTACLVGVFAGILVSEYQLLTPEELRFTESAAEGTRYLRSDSSNASLASRILAVDRQYRIPGGPSCEAAFQMVLDEVGGR